MKCTIKKLGKYKMDKEVETSLLETEACKGLSVFCYLVCFGRSSSCFVEACQCWGSLYCSVCCWWPHFTY